MASARALQKASAGMNKAGGVNFKGSGRSRLYQTAARQSLYKSGRASPAAIKTAARAGDKADRGARGTSKSTGTTDM